MQGSGPAFASVTADPFLIHTMPSQQIASGQQQTTLGGQAATRTVADAYNDAGTITLDNDPFLTHTMPSQPRPGAGATRRPGNAGTQLADMSVDVTADPFITAQFHAAPADVQAKRLNWRSALGQADEERKTSNLRVMVWLPWLLLIWVMLLFLCLRHFSAQLAHGLALVVAIFSVGLIVTWLCGRVSRAGLPLPVLGGLCLASVVLGACFGTMGWNNMWRQYWWTRTGAVYDSVAADTPAGARSDAAVLNFGPDTLVDVSRSAGYRDGSIYCVAPIVSPATASSLTGLTRVNYWAIGVDCCQSFGGFTCGDSRNYKGATGVVMLDDGFPCPGCNADEFRKAIAKAEAEHDLVSSPAVLMVRWAQSADAVQNHQLWQALGFLTVVTLLTFPIFYLAAYLFWYKGIGRGPFLPAVQGARGARLPLGGAKGAQLWSGGGVATRKVPMEVEL
eukprot:TRINITY_DN18828_c0_g1_i1.p1 TRINITY_DN18828_c0_g1~~TRINITY_DN18828_c0_g1_i1.p1  ORF type:complete len:449 (+),score=88.60 TRINITY_DN18828_c0_g1_i1:86-1432(+)